MNPIEEKEKIYTEGYEKTPEELKMAKVSAKLISQASKSFHKGKGIDWKDIKRD